MWETIEEIDVVGQTLITERMSVPGGWIYKVTEILSNQGLAAMSTCFVPTNGTHYQPAED